MEESKEEVMVMVPATRAVTGLVAKLTALRAAIRQSGPRVRVSADTLA
jgi:hypothetical protein